MAIGGLLGFVLPCFMAFADPLQQPSRRTRGSLFVAPVCTSHLFRCRVMCESSFVPPTVVAANRKAQNTIPKASMDELADPYKEREQVGDVSCLDGVVVAMTGNFEGERDHVFETLKSTTGGKYSGTVHKRVEFLVCDDKALEARTKHVRKAEKFGVPIVSYQYVEECIRVGRIVDKSPFILTPPSASSGEEST